MKYVVALLAAGLLAVPMIGGCGSMTENRAAKDKDEIARIERVIKNAITWAVTKDKELLYRSFVQDSTLFYFSPDNAGTISGIEAFRELVDNVFMNPAFEAIRADFRDLQINLSRTGDCAWWSCYLDDFNEWNGKPANWENVRWTGVLEKRDGEWRIVQMHFSHAVEDFSGK